MRALTDGVFSDAHTANGSEESQAEGGHGREGEGEGGSNVLASKQEVDMVAGGAGGAVDGLPGRHRVRRPLRRNKK